MASKAIYKCLGCKQDFEARTADRKRGWARFCSKSCKAIKQELQTGQFARLSGIPTCHQGQIGNTDYDRY